MPSSNKAVCRCHTNIANRSFNGAFIVYILLLSYESLLIGKIQKRKIIKLNFCMTKNN